MYVHMHVNACIGLLLLVWRLSIPRHSVCKPENQRVDVLAAAPAWSQRRLSRSSKSIGPQHSRSSLARLLFHQGPTRLGDAPRTVDGSILYAVY